MKKIFVVLLLAVLLGCAENKKADNGPVAVGADSVMVAKGYDEVKIFKTRTGHITTTLKVNGKSCVFLIDTGAGATLIDRSKRNKFGMESSGPADYAAGIGSVSTLNKTTATFQVNGHDIATDELYLMDISYVNSEFRKSHARQVDGVLGTDFLERHEAVIDYARCCLYLKVRNHGEE